MKAIFIFINNKFLLNNKPTKKTNTFSITAVHCQQTKKKNKTLKINFTKQQQNETK